MRRLSVKGRRGITAAALTALLTAASAGSARAQDAPVELARNELIRQAEEAARRGDHALAVDRARRAAELRSTPSVVHFLAREHEALERPLEALALAAACERGAEADRGLHNRDALLRSCRAIAARATARVGRVVVRVAEPVPRGLQVRVANTALPEALLGVPYAVSPGVVRVEAEAPGHAPALREVAVDAGGVEEVRVTLHALAPAPAPVEPVRPVADPPPPAPPPPAPPPPSRAPWIAVGVGLSVLAVGGFAMAGVWFGLANEAKSTRDVACASPCVEGSPGYAAAVEQDRRYRDHIEATTWSLVAGGALVAGAALWWVLARPTARSVSPSLAALPGGASVGLSTRW